MQCYSKFAPTPFDPRGAHLDDDRQDWLVAPCGLNRDSGILDRANFEALRALLEEHAEDHELHRFGHWACGWFEIIIVRPGSAAEKAGLDAEARLADYPVLDDDRYSELEYEEATEAWCSLSIADRIRLIKRSHRISVFAARHDRIPDGIDTHALTE